MFQLWTKFSKDYQNLMAQTSDYRDMDTEVLQKPQQNWNKTENTIL